MRRRNVLDNMLADQRRRLSRIFGDLDRPGFTLPAPIAPFPSGTAIRMAEYYAGAPMGSQEYEQYWRNFAESWSPGGSAPRIPGIGYSRPPQADAAAGTMVPARDDFDEILEELAQLYPAFSPGRRRELARRFLRRRFAVADEDY